jgi:hypothetical protein
LQGSAATAPFSGGRDFVSRPPVPPMTRRLLRPAAAALALALSACLDSTAPEDPPVPTDPATITYAPQLGVNLDAMQKSPQGLYYQDLVVGRGTTVTGDDSVVVSYAGYVPSGAQFTSVPATAPRSIRLSTSQIIFGFRQGLIGMAVGGKRKLVVPPLLGYGFRELRDENQQVILPSNSVLVFDVELLGRAD